MPRKSTRKPKLRPIASGERFNPKIHIERRRTPPYLLAQTAFGQELRNSGRLFSSKEGAAGLSKIAGILKNPKNGKPMSFHQGNILFADRRAAAHKYPPKRRKR